MFPIYIFVCLGITQLFNLPLFDRYDWLLFFCLLMQVLMVRLGIESIDELKVITVFHLIGLAMEIFKVNMGSWSYPGEAFFKVYGVPLFSSFMYASVASYLCQFWRRFDVELIKWPSLLLAVPLAAAIYLNFFTHHYIMDLRWILFVLIALTFSQAQLTFNVNRRYFKIPILMFFLLIGFLIWIGENIATFLGAWQYPNQNESWELVHLGKISSWLLLMIVSFLIVANLKVVKSKIN
ncbi:DUF817 domain-containing protein [Jeotgalibacillus malaysiensis]|uniref:DUF817 domain-containing protein n=1 Tax=Jeotgalibacillus malaysiensis TaxID=1508404 RepID=UPI00384E89A3